MYLCRNITGCSFPAIGAGFDRDHSTVIHACNLIARRINKDAAFGGLIQKIERQLKSPYQVPPDLGDAADGRAERFPVRSKLL
jgi:hypothetical protein